MSGDWRWRDNGLYDNDWSNPSEVRDRPGFVQVHRELHSYRPSLPSFIDDLHRLAEGLEDPYVEIEAEDEENAVLYVAGIRPMDDTDRARLDSIKGRAEQREREEFAALKAKFEPLAAAGGTEGDPR